MSDVAKARKNTTPPPDVAPEPRKIWGLAPSAMAVLRAVVDVTEDIRAVAAVQPSSFALTLVAASGLLFGRYCACAGRQVPRFEARLLALQDFIVLLDDGALPVFEDALRPLCPAPTFADGWEAELPLVPIGVVTEVWAALEDLDRAQAWAAQHRSYESPPEVLERADEKVASCWAHLASLLARDTPKPDGTP